LRRIAVPYIPGDGIGPETIAAARAVVDAAVLASEGGSVSISWEELPAGDAAHASLGEWLPARTLTRIREAGVALKGPLSTPVGGGVRSLNVQLRQSLDLYASVRPVRYFSGVPSPVRHPERVDLVIFRENTEDVYKGIEWKRGSPELNRLRETLRSDFAVDLGEDVGLGLKPISEGASKRLVRASIEFAVRNGRKSVTLVHKGNIMKFTEGAFRDWGYELALSEFRSSIVTESELANPKARGGKVLVNDRIADNMFQQVLLRPEDYSVLATPNLNGDYLADACAAQVGGLGLAPGANMGDHVAVFEPVHGTAPKHAGKDVANPCAAILSGAMMLEHLGLGAAGRMVVESVGSVLAAGVLTSDLARMAGHAEHVGTRAFGDAVVSEMEGH
jgi:isocitrate dehydrogenase